MIVAWAILNAARTHYLAKACLVWLPLRPAYRRGVTSSEPLTYSNPADAGHVARKYKGVAVPVRLDLTWEQP